MDNSQIILSSDEVKAYRVILTKATKYYDDYREFSVYFVELSRNLGVITATNPPQI